MYITTTNTIEGFEIEKYLGIVYGTEIYLVGGLMGGGLSNQELLFGSNLENATERMIAKAKHLHADAIIGVQTSFTSPGNVNYMIIALTGTAVKFTKESIALFEQNKIIKKEKEEKRIQEEEKRRKEEIKRKQEEFMEQTGTSPTTPIIDGNYYICPTCKKRQQNNRTSCFRCGTIFKID